MNNFLINNLEKTIANSNVLNSQFQDVQGQLAFVFEFLLDENKQKGIFLIAENDDFNILQIFVRYPQTVSKENIPQALVALNRINSISIAGFLMLSEENDIHYAHYKANLVLSKQSIESNYPENELLVFINSNLDMIEAFSDDLFKK
ncbi:MAG: hypothetical protein HQ474_05240 [Flammeovirgaceae bacterium]|jgi:hypothetical protein|nr:hypothetical protein [Flammeovirgaceae bacterium]|tara:strand:+ start:84 stop:524 length:441 start_codon:yes stop_codon:yes gene_type:complete